MREQPTRNRSHTEVIKALRRLFDAQYPEGGWLPTGREMAPRLGVSYLTYRKALDCMVREGWAASYPKRGHRVSPAYLRPRKVGIIYHGGDGGAPIGKTHVALRCLSDSGFLPQIVHASSLAGLCERAIVLGVKGVLWFSPPSGAAKEVVRLAGELPLVVENPQGFLPEAAPYLGMALYDDERINRARVAFMLNRGHRDFVYVGGHAKAERNGLVAAFRAGGAEFGPAHCVNYLVTHPGRLTQLLARLHVTGIIAEGGCDTLQPLLAELAELPDAAQPEVLVNFVSGLDELIRRFPKTRLLTPPWPPLDHDILFGAANMLVRHLNDGVSLGTLKVACTET